MDNRIQGFAEHLRETLASFPIKVLVSVDNHRCLVLLEYSSESGWNRQNAIQHVQTSLHTTPPAADITEVIVLGRLSGEKNPQWRKTFPLLIRTSQPLAGQPQHPHSGPIQSQPLRARPPSRPTLGRSSGGLSGTLSGQGQPLTPSVSNTPEAETGLILSNRYRVVKTLGSGGFSQTYLARDLQRPGNPLCVVKQLTLTGNDHESMELTRKLFHREAESLEKLGLHSQIPQLLAYFEENQKFYLIEEFIEGNPLSEEIDAQRFTEVKAKEILLDLLPVLAFIHENQIIHSDIKPDNIIRRQQDQKLVLIDFGAVKHLQPSNAVKRNTVALGTIGYAPVEQYTGQPQLNSDLYALGMVVLEALTGAAPTEITHTASGELDWQKHLSQPISPAFASILRQMVRVHFTQRYQLAPEVLADLQSGQMVQGKSETVDSANLEAALGLSLKMPTILTWVKQPRRLIGIAVGSLTIGIVLIGGQIWKLQQDTASARQAFQQGITFSQVDLWQAATTAYRQAVALIPIYPQAQTALAQSQAQIKELDNTIRQNRSLLLNAPRNTQTRLNLAVALYQKGDTAAAQTELSTALAFNPYNPEVYYHLGRVQAIQNDWKEARQNYQQALRLLPGFTLAQLYLGITYLEENKPAEAIATLKQAVAQRPGMPQAYYYLGQGYSRLSDWNNAIDSYLTALSLGPAYQHQHQDMGYGLYTPTQTDTAIQYYRSRLSQTPQNTDLYVRLGQAHRAEGDPDAAQNAFQEALRRNPKLGSALVELGSLYNANQQWDDALGTLSQAVAITPTDADAQRELGITLLGKALAQKTTLGPAIQHLQAAVNRQPNDPRTRQALATALAHNKQDNAAIAQLQEAIRLNPDATDSRTQLALLLVQRNQTQAAQAQLNQALDRDPTNANTHLAVASLQAQRGQISQALDQAQTAAQLEQSQPATNRADLTQKIIQEQAVNQLYSGVAKDKGQPQRTLGTTLSAQSRPAVALLGQLRQDKLATAQQVETGGSPAVALLTQVVLSSVLAVAVANLIGMVGIGAVWGLQTAGILPPSLNEKQWRAAKHCRKGIALIQEEKWAEAIWDFKAALKLNPNLAVAHYYLGQCWLQRGVLDDAITAFWVVKNLVPTFQEVNHHLITALLKLAQQLMEKREFDQAIDQYRFILNLYSDDDPERATAHLNLGEAMVLSRENRNWDLGIQELQSAIQLNPRSSKAHGILINAYFQKRDYKTALSSAQRMIDVDPDNADSSFLMAKALYFQGQLQPAIQQFTSILAQHPGLPEVRVSLALALMQAGQTNRARMDINTVLSHDPKDPLGLYAFALLLAIEGDLEESSRKCDLALRFNNRLSAAIALQGLLHLEQKRKDSRGQRFIQHRNIDLSQVKFETAIKGDLHCPEAHYGLGEIARLKREYVHAIESYANAVRTNGSYTGAHFKLAVVYYKLANFEKAIEGLQTVLRLNPDHPEAGQLVRKCIAGQATRNDFSTSIEDTSVDQFTSVTQTFM